MSNRRIRLLLLTPLVTGSLVVLPAAFAWSQASAAPAATCSISGVFPNGKVHLSGGGFTPGQALLSSPTAAGGSFTIAANGGFNMLNVENAQYTVSQGNQRTECSGFKGTTPQQDDEDNNQNNNRNMN
ncbi:hypothetical protein [Streptomyces sp. NBC_01565]|uniref:hypothetical protein n=1 Tax=Streptomyces sp. NBC_01565 TaxID=2975881 RepID=UPI00225066E8|nr:hypothetical protein [Streptomyces sp. NBC_01565]MCX4547137.1 hypothetical protein [Streptomyces sp. NBC_01565]